MASVNKRKWTHKGVEKEAWAVRYFDEKGVRRSKTFEQKKAADAFKRKVEREIEDGTHIVDAHAKPIKALAQAYLVDCNQRWRDGRIGQSHLTIETQICENRIIPMLGHHRARDLSVEHVDAFYRDMVRSGLSPQSAKRYTYTLKSIERFARKRGHMKTQPVTDALSDLGGLAAKRIRTFAPEEVARLLHVASERRKGYHARTTVMWELFVNLAAICGLRKGEIIGLTASDIDLENRAIRVRHNLTSHGLLKGPKTPAGVRVLPMPRRLAPMLEQWIAEHWIPNPRDLLFTVSGGTRVDQANMRKPWLALLKAAGLDGGETFHFHALRHFHASWLVNNGMPITEVSKLLGHSHFDMTLKVYAHALMSDGARIETVDRIAGLLPSAAPVTHSAVNG